MNILGNMARFFFQKSSNDFDANETFRRNQARYNALYALDPNVLVRHLEAFERGDICGLMRILEEFETREDKMRIGAFKMSAAVSSKPWEVRINKGEENNERAKLHQETLTKFWNRIETTDAFCRNRKGGLRLLVKQMMSAQSRVYSVHDIVWKVNGDGTLTASFTHVPAWCFENRTGRLRYIKNDGETHGEEMRDGEWLVTVGEGVGVPAAILAMAKRLSWNDWLLFSERCGMPVVVGKTPAPIGSKARAALARAIRSVAPKTGLVADLDAQMDIVSLGANGGPATYRALVDVVDRAISSLYRGGDLATVSGGQDAAGVNAQDGESELMDADGCAMISETLRDQVERFVIRFECGDFEPLAGIVINPPAETEDIDRDIKIDDHLAGLGVKLSKKDALARYGRTEAEDENDALVLPSAPVTDPASQKLTAQDIASLIYPLRAGGYKISQPVVERAIGLKLEEITPGDGVDNGKTQLANEKPGKTPLQTRENRLQNAPRVSDGQGDPSGLPPSQIAKNRPSGADGVLEAFVKDTGPAAKAVEKFLKAPSKEAAEKLLADLPKLLPDDPAMAAVIADEIAKVYVATVASSRPSQNGEEITQEQAEELYEEMMAK